jgi:regulator of sigma E protease
VYGFVDLQRLVSPAPGRPLHVTARRDGQTVELTMTPQRYEESDAIESVSVGKIGITPNPAAPVIGVTAPDTAAARAGLQSLDRVQSVNGEAVGSLKDALRRLETAYAAGRPFPVVAVRERPLAAGNVELALPQAFTVTVVPDAAPLGVESGDLYLGGVAPGSPAAVAGLARGDRLVAADGVALRSWEDVNALRRERNEKPFRLSYVHDGAPREITLAQATTKVRDEIRGRDVTSYVLGIDGGLPGLPAPIVHLPLRPVLALQVAMENTWDVTRKMVIGLGMLVTGQIAFSNVGGPIQIYDITAKAAEQGWEVFLHVMALISINLGLMNLLPVPVLDGGHIVQSGIEMVRRQPLSLRTREVANLVGVVLLVTLMLFAFKNDVVRFFLAG